MMSALLSPENVLPLVLFKPRFFFSDYCVTCYMSDNESQWVNSRHLTTIMSVLRMYLSIMAVITSAAFSVSLRGHIPRSLK